MVKWFKLFGSQYIGFWIIGLALFALQEAPYIAMPLFKLKSNPIMNMQESSVILDIAEKILGSLCIAIMTFIVSERTGILTTTNNREVYIWYVVGVLLLNYLGWGLYFGGYQSLFIMMFFVVVLPPLYYIFIGLWRDNIFLIIVGCFFGIVHFLHVWGNLHLH